MCPPAARAPTQGRSAGQMAQRTISFRNERDANRTVVSLFDAEDHFDAALEQCCRLAIMRTMHLVLAHVLAGHARLQ